MDRLCVHLRNWQATELSIELHFKEFRTGPKLWRKFGHPGRRQIYVTASRKAPDTKSKKQTHLEPSSSLHLLPDCQHKFTKTPKNGNTSFWATICPGSVFRDWEWSEGGKSHDVTSTSEPQWKSMWLSKDFCQVFSLDCTARDVVI